jgi:hypothetical protein
MIPVANMECVTNRPFGHDPNAKHQATVNMIARSGVCARTRAQARGRGPAPLPARVAMALAPPSKFPHTFLKHHYDIKLLFLRAFSKHHYDIKLLWNIPHVSFALIFISGVEFIEVHGPDGQRAFLNPKAISSLREPIATDLKGFAKGVRCVVVTTNGKFIAVVETCTAIRDVLGYKP